MLSIAVSIAVGLMLAWHTYLILSGKYKSHIYSFLLTAYLCQTTISDGGEDNILGQTTIEFYYNRFRAREAKQRGMTYRNPFDLGYRHNWQQFFGKQRYANVCVLNDDNNLTVIVLKIDRYWFSWLLPTLDSPPGNASGLLKCCLNTYTFFIRCVCGR